jgi:DNA mismatch repair ATPase MutS
MLSSVIFSYETNENAYRAVSEPTSINRAEIIRNLTNELFGASVKTQFGIVNPAPFSELEERVFAVLFAKFPQPIERLESLYNSCEPISMRITALCNIEASLLFYIGVSKFISQVKENGVAICIPAVGGNSFIATDVIAPTLIAKYMAEGKPTSAIVPNDIFLPRGEAFILSGANQGGKTAYLQTVGLTAHLAMCGCPVFAASCTMPFYDGIYTHFNSAEALGKGRLVEETERIETILKDVTETSLVLLNESFTSTRRIDGVELFAHYLNLLLERGVSVGAVSHYYEIPKYIDRPVTALVCGVREGGERTYKISAAGSGGQAYAADIAAMCRMTYEDMTGLIS